MTNNEKRTNPVMPEIFLNDFVDAFFQRKETFVDAVRQFGSPLYVLEVDILKDRAKQFKEAFKQRLANVNFYYAIKSNNLPYISQILLKEGFGLDVSSGLELETAIKLNAKDIIFSGPGKTNEELSFAVKHSSRVTLLLDSMGELNRLKAHLNMTKVHLKIGVRVNNNPKGLWQKFGIPLDKLQSFYDAMKTCPYLHFCGVQFHSSWNLEPSRQIDFIKILGKQLKKMPADFLESIEFIDIGGGYWPSQGEWLLSKNPLEHYLLPANSIETFADLLSTALKKHILHLVNCTICFEPGRWICNDAMHILLSVIDRKSEDLVVTDAGTNTIGWERFETDYFPVLNLTQHELVERPCNILGSLCTPHDIWGSAYFGKNICDGDILMIPTQGAYTYSLRQEFIKPLPKVLVMAKNETFEI